MPRRGPQPRPAIDRVLDKVLVDERGCWLFQGSLSHNGYGQTSARVNGQIRHLRAHRVTYEHFIGPIPEALTLDHLCRVRHCVNPHHLEPVTMRENLLRGNTLAALFARATHCVNGHEFTEANTYVTPRQRQCRICKREQLRRWRQKHAEHYRLQRQAWRAQRRAEGKPAW